MFLIKCEALVTKMLLDAIMQSLLMCFFFVFFKHDLHRITFMVSLALISVCPWRKMRA